MNSFFRKNAVIGLAEIVCRLPLVFTVGYLARSVGVEVFGNWALVLAFQVFIVGVAGLGLSSALTRYVPACQPGEAGAFLRYAFILCLMPLLSAALLSYALRTPIVGLLGLRSDLGWLLPLAVLLAAGSVADGFLDAFFKGLMAVGRQVCFIAVRTLVEVVAVVSVFVIAAPSHHEAPARLAAYVGVVAFGKIAIYPLLLIGLTKGERLPAKERRYEFLKFGLPMVPTLLAVWLVNQSDRLVLSHFVAKSDLGVYAFGASLATYMVFLGYAAYPLLLPAASKLHDDGRTTEIQALFYSAQKLFMLLWAAGMTCLALWFTEIIAWTGGSAFAGAGHVFLILCFAAGIEHLTGVYQYVFDLVKRTDIIFWLHLGYAGVMVISLAIAGYAGGIVWAPWAVLVATVVFNIVRYRIALRYFLLPFPRIFLPQVVALSVWTALLAHYAADWNMALRAAVTAAVCVSLASYVLLTDWSRVSVRDDVRLTP